ncbi:hypothetical protein [Streptomyces sp. NPDC096323]|uniref:hypothetical protein n=1 Tax=Streptomyces sp. NPDC096323 TaxID=3155822 RepID=UPI003329F567
MTTLVVHDTTEAWTSAHPALEVTTGSRTVLGRDATVNLLRYEGSPGSGPPDRPGDGPPDRPGDGPQDRPEGGAAAEFVPPQPLDLTAWEELRMWIRATVPADGTPARPFYLALSYEDAHDTAEEQHRWFVPVNEPQGWEQRVICIGADRRGAIARFRLEAVGAAAFTVELFRLVAVREEMLRDIEDALADALSGVRLPGATEVPIRTTVNPAATTVVIDLALGVAVGNRILLRGAGPLSDEVHDVVQVDHEPATGRTVLAFAADSPVLGTFTAGTSSVSVLVPVSVEGAAVPGQEASARIVLRALDVLEVPERSGGVAQRDSFRRRGQLTTCAVRPPARAYAVSYRVTPFGADRAQQLAIHTDLLARLGPDRALWINDAPAPVQLLAPSLLEDGGPQPPSPLSVLVASRLQTGSREEVPWASGPDVRVGRPDTAGSDEGQAPRR